jgi:uncharacterized protein YjdB
MGVVALVAAVSLRAWAGTEPCGDARYHDADTDQNYALSFEELLRQIQFYNSASYYYCPDDGTSDGYCPGPPPARKEAFPCEDQAIHDTDQNGDNLVGLTELLRLIQFFSVDGFYYCPGQTSEDGFCPGTPDATVTLTPLTATIGATGAVALSATSTNSAEGFIWETDNPEVATVDSAGGVLAVAPGTVTIRATGDQSGGWEEAAITVSSDTLEVSPSPLFVTVTGSDTLSVSSSAPGDTFTFSSGNESIATVSGTGDVSPVAAGDTTITVTSDTTQLTVEVPVTVIANDREEPGPGAELLELMIVPNRPFDPVVQATLADSRVFYLHDPADSENYNTRYPDLSGDTQDEKQVPSVTVPTRRPFTRYVNHAAFQTPIRNQQDRNTCTLFAVTAALEAAYNRAGYGVLDLSEQHFNHIGKSTWLHPFVDEPRPRGVWESQLGMTSGGGVYVVALLKRYGIPMEAQVPYRHSNQAPYTFGDYHSIRQPGDNPTIMTGLTRQDVTQRDMDDFNLENQFTTWTIPGNYGFTPLADVALRDGQYGVLSYERCPPSRIKDISWWENVLHMGYEIAFQANLVWDTVDGEWVARDLEPDEPLGSHAMLMVGYDRRDPANPYFIVKNQWGESNYLKLDYNWVTENLDGTMTHAIFITDIADPANNAFSEQIALGRWTIETDLYTDPGELDIFRQAQLFPPEELDGKSDRRIGEFYDVSDNPYKVNGFVFPNFVEWYLDFANPNADFGDIDGNRFFGYFDVEDPDLMAGYYIDTTGQERGFYGSKSGVINARSIFSMITSDEAYLGRWEIINPDVDGYLEVTEVGNSPGIIAVTYEAPGGARTPYGTNANSATREVTIPFTNFLVDNKGTFEGHILETNTGIMTGYFQPSSGARNAMVLRRINYANIDVEITEPGDSDSFLVGDTVSLQADTFGDGFAVGDPDMVRWSINNPVDEGGTLIDTGADAEWDPPSPGTYNIFVVYTENALTGPAKRAEDQVTITVGDANGPEVTITEPADETTYNDIRDPAVFSVMFSGEAVDNVDGNLPGNELVWSYREQGDPTWISAGTGSSVTIDLEDTQCFVFTNYEIRLQATDSDDLTGTDIITVGVNGLFCR